MIWVPLELLMPTALHEEFQLWLLHVGCEKMNKGSRWAEMFLKAVENGDYCIAPPLRADAHRLFCEINYEQVTRVH